MAAIAVQQVKPAGTTVTFASASGGGDTIALSGDTTLIVRNADASAKTVTLVRPGTDEFGLAIPDVTLSVAAGAQAHFGPIPVSFRDPTTKLVSVTYSAVTSVTVAAVRA